jgi:hypothetical protein
MPELKEVFDMVSQKVEPDLDSWNQQERRQRRRKASEEVVRTGTPRQEGSRSRRSHPSDR